MDRIISLLAALVGLIALGGAILVHVNGDAQRSELAAEIAGLKASLTSPAAATPVPAPEAVAIATPSSSSQVLAAEASAAPSMLAAVASSAEPDTAAQLRALQDRIAELERINSEQASELADARAQVATAGPSSIPLSSTMSVAAISAPAPLAPPSSAVDAAPSAASSTAASAQAADNADCIPVGTRFMGKTGDSFPICKTKAVVKVASVTDGSATIEGTGPIAAGSFADLTTKGCTVMVFSADTTGYAEMRVTCN